VDAQSDCAHPPAGVPRKPNQSRDDLFNTNASIVATLVDGVAK
jgi:malate dehydrogenase